MAMRSRSAAALWCTPYVLAAAVAGTTAAMSLPQHALEGRWEGAIAIAGQTIPLAVTFHDDGETPTARVEIQGGTADLQNVINDPPSIQFELPAGPGVAEFDGERSGSVIRGVFRQAGAEGSFRLERVGPARAIAEGADVEPGAQEVSIPVDDGVVLAGTLRVPDGPGPFPAVVLISGSGTQDRDEAVAGMKPFKLLADGFAADGIATLRLDDRGVGGSGGSVFEMQLVDTAGDVRQAIEFLRTKPIIDTDAIGVLGHSEGAIVATLVADDSELVAFAIMLAGPAVPIERVMQEQAQLILSAQGMPDDQIAEQQRIRAASFDAVRTGEGWPEVREMMAAQVRGAIEALPEAQRAAIGDVDAFVDAQVEQQVSAAQTPWFRELLDYDPSGAIASVEVPLLAVYGENDLQVPAETNATAMRRLAPEGSRNFTIRVIPGVNHLFQATENGSPALYGSLAPQFAPDLLPTLSGWIGEHVR